MIAVLRELDMRFLVACGLFLTLNVNICRAETFQPTEQSLTRIANRLRVILDKSGIRTVSNDVMKCYDDNLSNATKLKECAVYDTAAFIIDKTMVRLFIARGIPNAAPAPLYVESVFDARLDTYGRLAFRDDLQGFNALYPAAQRVVEKALPRK